MFKTSKLFLSSIKIIVEHVGLSCMISLSIYENGMHDALEGFRLLQTLDNAAVSYNINPSASVSLNGNSTSRLLTKSFD
jgi:hypothetical protein